MDRGQRLMQCLMSVSLKYTLLNEKTTIFVFPRPPQTPFLVENRKREALLALSPYSSCFAFVNVRQETCVNKREARTREYLLGLFQNKIFMARIAGF